MESQTWDKIIYLENEQNQLRVTDTNSPWCAITARFCSRVAEKYKVFCWLSFAWSTKDMPLLWGEKGPSWLRGTIEGISEKMISRATWGITTQYE